MFSFEEVEEFTEPVVEDVQILSTLYVCVSLLGVESISAYCACRKCGKKTSSKNNSVLQCETCHMVQKSGSGFRDFSLRM
jgi:Zn finger protein HypA/HybF involved in hydrogenase expression